VKGTGPPRRKQPGSAAPEGPAHQRETSPCLDGGDEDLRRLLTVSEVTAEPARRAFLRVGVSAGWTAIDCGCGPLGGLAVLAELVGPAGRVAGVDSSDSTIQRARSAVTALGLENVDLIAGDIHDLNPTAQPSPRDRIRTGTPCPATGNSCTR
jgi:hypothetical protein